MKYLGLMVSLEGYEVDPNNDAALETLGKMSEPVGESQLLFAFIRHYQDYKKKFSVTMKPVNKKK